MRVALISPLFESVPPRLYGGTERVIHNLIRGLSDADIEVVLFASGDSTVECRVVPVVDEALRLRKRPVFDANACNFRMLSMVARQADEFDIIHNHHDYWMLPLSAMTSVPLVTTLHGRLDLPDIASAFFAYPDCHFVSISDSQRSPLEMLPWARTIHHGIDVDTFEFHPRPGKYLAFLGRMSRDKRPDWAIQIAKASGVPLKMAAKIGEDDRDYFEANVKPHIDGRFIEFVGEITENEKSEFLGNALGLVFPIDWPEPFGLVQVESLACGTPVLARPCGAALEILKDGVTGFCHAEIDTLARRVKDLARIDRAGCRAWVTEKFSLKRMTEDYIHVYRKLIDSGRARSGYRRAWGPAGDRRDLLYSV